MSGKSSFLRACIALAIVTIAIGRASADFVPMCEIPSVGGTTAHDVVYQYARLMDDRAKITGNLNVFNARCASVRRGSDAARRCQSDLAALSAQQQAHNADVNRFCASVRQWATKLGDGELSELLGLANYSALNDYEFAALLGGEPYSGGDDIRALANRSDWAIVDKARGLTAALLAEAGRYRDAAIMLLGLKQRQPGDADALARIGRKLAPPAGGTKKPPESSAAAREVLQRLNVGHLPVRAEARVLMGVQAMRDADYESAVRHLTEAQKISPHDAGLRDAIFLAGQVKRASEIGPPPSPLDRRARALQHDGGMATLLLAFHLLENRQPVQAEAALLQFQERYLRVRRSDVDTAGLPADDYIRQMIDTARTKPESVTAPPGRRTFDHRSKADLMLDALSYGRGNWSTSLRYLEIAREADKWNPQLLDAYNELSAIAASAR